MGGRGAQWRSGRRWPRAGEARVAVVEVMKSLERHDEAAVIFHKAGRRTPEEQAEDPDKRATCDEAIAVLRAFADDGGLPSKVSIFGGDDAPRAAASPRAPAAAAAAGVAAGTHTAAATRAAAATAAAARARRPRLRAGPSQSSTSISWGARGAGDDDRCGRSGGAGSGGGGGDVRAGGDFTLRTF